MSFKYHAQKVGDAHYVLPRCGAMKVDAHAFFSDDLYAASEESLWNQLANGASYDGIIGAYLMPDGHSGFGVPIGCVLVTENTIIQAGSGYDINCGIVCLETTLNALDIQDLFKRRRWVSEVEKRVATGIGSNRPSLMPVFNNRNALEILHYGAKFLGVSEDLCERQFIPVPENIDLNLVSEAYAKVLPQLGSVGSGNHYVELLVDESTGGVFAMVHCGSRGYGYKIAEYFFYHGAKLRGLAPNRREESWLRIDEPLGKEYWAYHNSAANFAIVNRHVIVRGVQQALQEVFRGDSSLYYEISHNLVQEETLVLPDGSTKRGFVHRKGATRAFPAGHPDLVGTKWEKTGHPCLIPGSMRDGAAILFAEPGSIKSAYSVNHGSGRLIPRGRARRELADQQDQIDLDMATIERTLGGVQVTGIATNNPHVPLDECSKVYKDLDSVLDVLEVNQIAKVHKRLYPVANLKGSDSQ